jgi:predicted HAD superfamily Cof-like phosphohydrolase
VRLVREFHEAFEIPVKDGPTIPYLDRVKLRRRLINEEFDEVMEEFDRIEQRLERGTYTSVKMVLDDVARLAKELSDLRVVCEGTELEFGIPGDAVYAEVHRSNMSKLGEDGRPVRRHDGKVLKGPNYEEANVLLVLGVVEGTTE